MTSFGVRFLMMAGAAFETRVIDSGMINLSVEFIIEGKSKN